jgi:hypothetical protein
MHRGIAIALALATAVAGVASAQSPRAVQFHGFGSWAYGNTDGNTYLFGTDQGSYDNTSFALNVNAAISDQLTIAAQMDWATGEMAAGGNEVEVDLSFAFVEWRFSDALRLRAGRVKQPFGLYTEILDVGTARPFIDLPQGVYGGNALTTDAYEGLGLKGRAQLSSTWGIEYSLYGGLLDLPLDVPDFSVIGVFVPDSGELRDVVGGQVVLEPPIAGLRFGASAYRGVNSATEAPGGPGPILVVGESGARTAEQLFVEYLGDHLWVRGEVARNTGETATVDAAYAEIAYKLDRHWQVAGRWDWSEIDTGALLEGFPTWATAITRHKDLAIALNYWFSPDLVVKLEYHDVQGNRYAWPEDWMPVFLGGALDDSAKLVQFGVQFSF